MKVEEPWSSLMKTKPFFSVIIPTLNEELFLPKILSDLKKQTEKNFEIIIVDARSSDQTKKKASEFKSELLLLFFETNKRNLSYQRNFGASRAKGTYIIFLDADTRVSSTLMKKLYREVAKSKHLIYLPTLVPDTRAPRETVLFKIFNFFIEISQNSTKPLPTGSMTIFQKDFFNFLGGYAGTKEHDKKKFYPEDHDLILRASESGVKAKFLRNIKVKFSLRRTKKEGAFNVFKKYMTTAVEMTFKGRVEKSFEHEMGGHFYAAKQKNLPKNQLEEIIDQIKKVF